MKPTKQDWKIFQDSLPNFRERYLTERNKTFIAMLNDDKRTATEQYWDTYDAMKKEGKILRDCLDGISKSGMDIHILLMLRHGLMKEDDLNAFSDDFQDWVQHIWKWKSICQFYSLSVKPGNDT